MFPRESNSHNDLTQVEKIMDNCTVHSEKLFTGILGICGQSNHHDEHLRIELL